MKSLECRKLTTEWKQSLVAFLKVLEENQNDVSFFHPHGSSEADIENILQNAQKDLYYVLVEEQEVLGYGVLRGWDEGYEIPSLGIAIHPRMRGVGLGKAFMYFLHTATALRGANKVRLRVKVDNVSAIKLYQSLGYFFATQEESYLVGTLDLHTRKHDN